MSFEKIHKRHKYKQLFISFIPYNHNNGAFIQIHIMNIEYLKQFQVVNRIKTIETKLNECLKNKNYSSYFILLEKPIRIEKLNELYLNIPNKDFLEIFKFVYSSSEYNFEDINKNIFNKVKQLSYEKIKHLENELTIYRGQLDKSQNYDTARSWTLDYNIAKFFATRFKSKKGKLYSANIKKKDIDKQYIKINKKY